MINPVLSRDREATPEHEGSPVIGTRPLMDGLLHLVQQGGACGPAQSPPPCTKCSNNNIIIIIRFIMRLRLWLQRRCSSPPIHGQWVYQLILFDVVFLCSLWTPAQRKRASMLYFANVFFVERPALAVRLDLSFRSVYFIFFSGNIFRTAEPISTKVCTVTASGQE